MRAPLPGPSLTCLLLLPFLAACSSLPEQAPPLRDMEEPIALKQEPDDEAARKKLALGAFSGVYVKSAWFEEPDEPGQQPDALAVERIVENSPGAAAGLREGDLLVSATLDGTEHELRWPSQWKKLEAENEAGTTFTVLLDRAGVEHEGKIELIARVRPPERVAAETFREEQNAGIVVRTATEVEARAANLGNGGGAVLIGMAGNSPWRAAGMRFEDLVVKVGDRAVDHPQVLLGAIRTADPESDLRVEYVRGGTRRTTAIPLTTRDTDLTEVSVYGLFSYTDSRDATEFSILFGLLGYESTRAAWRFRLLWLFCARGGDSDVLREARR